jgi:hypothetical protein
VNPGDAVADLNDGADIHHRHGGAELLYLLFDDGDYIFASRRHNYILPA